MYVLFLHRTYTYLHDQMWNEKYVILSFEPNKQTENDQGMHSCHYQCSDGLSIEPNKAHAVETTNKL